MIAVLLAIGANVPGAWGPPRTTVDRLPGELANLGIAVEAVSMLHVTEPVGPVAQPQFVNGALRVSTDLPPLALLAVLKALERAAGRGEGVRWGPRPLDIDILGYGDRVIEVPGRLVVPHPEMAKREFVLRPLAEIAPDWRHPATGLTVREMLNALS